MNFRIAFSILSSLLIVATAVAQTKKTAEPLPPKISSEINPALAEKEIQAAGGSDDVFQPLPPPKDPKIDLSQIKADEQAQILEEALDAGNGPPPKIEIIVDSSGSMGQLLQMSKTKMFFVKKTLSNYFADQWKKKALIGMRVYGSRVRNSCDDNILAVKFNERSLGEIEKQVAAMTPLGMTPLHKSVSMAVQDLKDYEGPKRIVIFTDGEETCKGDPCKLAAELKKHPELDIQIFVVAIGFGAKSDRLKKVACLGQTHQAESENDLNNALSSINDQVNSHSTKKNLFVKSPNPSAQVHLYQTIDGESRWIKTFTAKLGIEVPPGEYEAVVALQPLYKFEKFKVPPKKRVTLAVEGKGQITVKYFSGLVKAQLLNDSLKPILEFKSDTPVTAPIGKWKLRVFKEPYYEKFVPTFYVYPNGEHFYEVGGVGVVRVMTPQISGLYVYDGKDRMLGNYLTNFPIVLKTGTYRLHVNPQCTFKQVSVGGNERILDLRCE